MSTQTSPDLDAYEREFAARVGARNAVAFGYARHALTALLTAAGLRAGDEVILSPLTCKVVPLALLGAGFRPVFADVDLQTLNLDAHRVDAAVRAATRAILFQHTYGNSSGLAAVAAQAAAKGLLLIQDCAQCTPEPMAEHGARTARAALFSNNLRKPLPAGSGGVAITDDDELAERTRRLRDAMPAPARSATVKAWAERWLHRHVLTPERYWFLYGLQRRFATRAAPTLAAEIATEIHRSARRPSTHQIRLGRRSLSMLGEILSHRRLCCAEYAAALRSVPNVTLPCSETADPLFYFPVLVANKDALLDAARRQRIELIAWPLRTPIYPVERPQDLGRYGYTPGSAPVAEDIARRLVGLPTDLAAEATRRAALVALLRRHSGVGEREHDRESSSKGARHAVVR